MKKILLLLSCFLATWCSVYAATPSGKINSATYNASNSTVSINFTADYCSSVKLVLMYLPTNNGGYFVPVSPLCQTTCSVLNRKGYKSTAILNVDGTLPEGYYYVGLYPNGGKNLSDGPIQVNGKITANGSIKDNVKYDDGKLSVEYTMWHGFPNETEIWIYNENNRCVYQYEQPVPNTKVNEFKKITFPIELSDGKYTCRLIDRVKDLDKKPFEVRSHWYSGVKITPMGGHLKIDFTLSNTGVDVAFRVTAASLTNYKGETNTYYYGRCDQHEGTYEVSVPQYTGQVIYAVELLVNGSSVNGASIQVYR